MGTNDKPVHDHYQIGLTKGFDGSPEGCLTTTGRLSDGGFFGVDLTIIGPKPKQPEGDLPLTRSETNYLLKAMSDVIMSLKEKPF